MNVQRTKYYGAQSSIEVMRRAVKESSVDVSVRALAEKICAKLHSKDYASEYLAIYHFVMARTRYMRDPVQEEWIRSPSVMVAQIMAGQTPSLDCDDSSLLIAALINSIGGTCRFVTVAFNNMVHRGERQYSHVYCEAFEPRSGKWICLDTVAAENSRDMINRVQFRKNWPI